MIVAGGGTGGHLFPGLAVAEAAEPLGHEVLFVGSASGIEARVVPETRFPFRAIPIRGLRGRGLRGAVELALQLPAAVARAWRITAVPCGSRGSTCLRNMGFISLGTPGNAATRQAGCPSPRGISAQIPGAVPREFGIGSLPAGNIAWMTFRLGIPHLRLANIASICSSDGLCKTSSLPIKSARH